MANPNSRNKLIQYCKRKLGEPVIEVNVDEDQIEDRIDEALFKLKTGFSLAKIPIFSIETKSFRSIKKCGLK